MLPRLKVIVVSGKLPWWTKYGGLYNEKNVAISGIHTHAGPGGYLQYVVYIVTSLGFVRQSFDVIVDGIEKSIIQAHENLRPGSIYVNKGDSFGIELMTTSGSTEGNNLWKQRLIFQGSSDSNKEGTSDFSEKSTDPF
eukprot:Gb_04888 [translate_table: standard]